MNNIFHSDEALNQVYFNLLIKKKKFALALLGLWANILLQAKDGFRSYIFSSNTLSHFYAWLHSSTAHISRWAAKPALL